MIRRQVLFQRKTLPQTSFGYQPIILVNARATPDRFYWRRSTRVPTELVQDLENDLALPEACRFSG